MSSAELLRLAERVEGLTGPDREIDALIWAELDNRDVRWTDRLLLAKSRKPPHDECRVGYIDPGVVNRNFSLAWSQPPIPTYTSSLDAAMSLVPEGWWWSGGVCKRENHASVGSEAGTFTDEIIFETFGANLPLALCAAALRAKARALARCEQTPQEPK